MGIVTGTRVPRRVLLGVSIRMRSAMISTVRDRDQLDVLRYGLVDVSLCTGRPTYGFPLKVRSKPPVGSSKQFFHQKAPSPRSVFHKQCAGFVPEDVRDLGYGPPAAARTKKVFDGVRVQDVPLSPDSGAPRQTVRGPSSRHNVFGLSSSSAGSLASSAVNVNSRPDDDVARTKQVLGLGRAPPAAARTKKVFDGVRVLDVPLSPDSSAPKQTVLGSSASHNVLESSSSSAGPSDPMPAGFEVVPSVNQYQVCH